MTIEYWTHEDSSRTRLEEKLIASFMEEHPSITIVRKTFSSSSITDLIPRAFAAGKGPDLFNLQLESEFPMITKGYVAPVDWKSAGYSSLGALRDTYIDGVLDCVTRDGNVYGMPLEYTNWCLYLNKKAFSDVGLDAGKDYPRTWEDIVSLSQKLVVRDGNALKERGFDFRYPYYLNFLVPMVEQKGGALLSEDGKTGIIGEDAWISVLSFMRDWGPNGNNLGSPTYQNARYAFMGKDATCAMALSGLYQERRMASNYPDFYDSREWMVVPFPTFRDAVDDVSSCVYAHFLMVNAASGEKERKAAWMLVGFLLSHGDEYLSQTGLVQPTKEMISSPILNQIPYGQVFLNDLKKSHLVYYGERSAEIQNLLATAVESVMLGGVSPEKAYVTLKTSVQELLDEKKE